MLQNIKVKTSRGAEGLPNAFLRRYSEIISEYLNVLFNASLNQTAPPRDWLTARVVSAFKFGDNLDAGNYRPISLISTCCKVFEHIITSHVSNYLEWINVFDKSHHGFRRKVSTRTQVLSVVHDFGAAIDNHHQVDEFFSDLSKAFDSVPHGSLVDKLLEVRVPDRSVR